MESLNFPSITPAPRSPPEFLAWAGLGTPGKRAAAAFVIAAVIGYALKQPASAFTPDGQLRRFSIGPNVDEENPTTQVPFVVMPVCVAAAAYIFL
jgi:hypothetical protein